MRYSVMNVATRQYDYYDTPEATPWHAPAPPAAKHVSALGACPEDAAWPLPANAVHVGSGAEAQGRIAEIDRPLGIGAMLGMGASPLESPGVLVAVGVAAFYLLHKSTRSRR